MKERERTQSQTVFIRRYSALLLIFSLVGATAFARNGRMGRGHDLRILFEAINETIECNFNAVKYKVRTAKLLTRFKRGSDIRVLQDFLQKTEDVLADGRLKPREKLSLAMECLAQATPILIDYYADVRGQRGQLGAALRYMRLAKLLAKAGKMDAQLFYSAKSVLRDAKFILKGCLPDLKIRVAIEALDKSMDVVSDDLLSADEKLSILEDCLQLASQSVRQSSAFTNSW